MERQLEGLSAVVTAGGSGIGAAAARAIAADGAKVTIGDLDAARAEAVAAEIRAAGGEALGMIVDARSPESVAALVAAAQQCFGPLHLAHLNAGGGVDSPILDGSLERFEASIAITLVSQFIGLQAVAPAIIAAGGGAIVLTSSQTGLIGQPGITGYVASKHGVIGLTKSAAAELAPYGIRVNCVCPSAIYTGIFGGAFADEAQADAILGKYNIMGRVGRPREVGDVVAFLLSERASFMTAAAIPIDAGNSVLQSPQFVDEIQGLAQHIKGLGGNG
jgi:NAD(P)-dependent dehydrogenase (short-subunit alcohol dehydrogenase family)